MELKQKGSMLSCRSNEFVGQHKLCAVPYMSANDAESAENINLGAANSFSKYTNFKV